MSDNQLGRKGAEYLAKIIEDSDALVKLYANGNVGFRGGKALVFINLYMNSLQEKLFKTRFDLFSSFVGY